jgi:hypothetical protein
MSKLYADRPIRLQSYSLPIDRATDVCVMVDGKQIIIKGNKRRWKVIGVAGENVSIEECPNEVYVRWKYKKTLYEIRMPKQDALPRTFLPGPFVEALGLVMSLKLIAAV